MPLPADGQPDANDDEKEGRARSDRESGDLTNASNGHAAVTGYRCAVVPECGATAVTTLA